MCMLTSTVSLPSHGAVLSSVAAAVGLREGGVCRLRGGVRRRGGVLCEAVTSAQPGRRRRQRGRIRKVLITRRRVLRGRGRRGKTDLRRCAFQFVGRAWNLLEIRRCGANADGGVNGNSGCGAARRTPFDAERTPSIFRLGNELLLSPAGAAARSGRAYDGQGANNPRITPATARPASESE